MVTKVLVFESDPAFAGELRNEFGKLGCSTTVVEDGNIGLQQAATDRPDLILLSIELPRMNGFSVCNKLKKDPNLKEVPLIIMSSESTDETFEQHKKLRTRAEDYVHKPIAFGELLQHIQSFVPLAPASQDSDAAIVIDDEIEIGSTDYVSDDVTEDGPLEIAAVESSSRVAGESVDDDVEAFAESAFGRLTGSDRPNGEAMEMHTARNGAGSIDGPVSSVPHLMAAAPTIARAPSSAPASRSQGVDPAEHLELRDELSRTTARLQELGRALDEVHAEVEKLRPEAAEAQRRAREVDELRARLASGAKSGVSSREFLDLRETLNKKDKEILSLKELLSKKDKQIVEAQDRALALERGQSEVEDRLLALERELDDTKEKSETLLADRDLAKKASEDFRARLEKARADVDGRDRHLAELKTRHTEEAASAEARLAAMRAEVDQILANERAEHARALDDAEARRKAEVEEGRADHETMLASARAQWEKELAEVKSEAERRAQTSLEDQRNDLQATAARDIGAANDRATKLGVELGSAQEEASSLRQAVEGLEGRLEAAQARIATMEAEVSGVGRQLAAVEEKVASESARADRALAKWQADRQSLERAKDALAAALAQIEEVEERPA